MGLDNEEKNYVQVSGFHDLVTAEREPIHTAMVFTIVKPTIIEIMYITILKFT